LNSAGTASALAPATAIFSYEGESQSAFNPNIIYMGAAETYQLLNLLFRETSNIVHGTIRKAKRVGLDGSLTLSFSLLGRARLIGSALTAVEPVATSGSVTARVVCHANICSAVGVLLVCPVSAATTGVGLGVDVPGAWDLSIPH